MKRISFYQPSQLPILTRKIGWEYPFTLVDSSAIGKPEEKSRTTSHVIQVSATFELIQDWGFSLTSLNDLTATNALMKILFEHGKRNIGDKLKKTDKLLQKEELLLTRQNSEIPCPYDPVQIEEPSVRVPVVIEVDFENSKPLSKPNQDQHVITTEYHFHGNVGAVQTGTNAVADVIQKNNSRSEPSSPKCSVGGVSSWRSITFTASRDLGPALLGRALGPSDAAACPRLIEADVIVRQLQRAFSARLIGVPGSGKSVSAYQAAQTLVSQGWLALRLGSPKVDCVSLESSHGKSTLFLIDDAHLMDQDVLRALEEQACRTKLLLTIHTAVDRTSDYRGAISMDGSRAVQTIASTLKSNLSQTLSAVRRVDDNIGDTYLDEDLERRIDDAQASSQFPWQFCFVLGGGWRRANEAADASRVNGADLILAIAATQQIASRDAVTTRETILRLGLLAGLTENDVRIGLSWLVRERLLLSENDLRCPHQRFAAAIVGRIYSRLDATKRASFTRICRTILIDEATTLAGAKVLIQELRHSGFNLPWIAELEPYRLIDEETRSVLLAKCWRASTPEDRMFACLIIAELGGKHNWPDLLPYTQIKQLGDWISEAVHPMGYGLGQLLNNIYNEDKVLAAQIVSAANTVAVASLASAANATTAYTISEMLDRMALVCNQECKESIRWAFDRDRILQTVAQWPEGEYIGTLSKFCWALSLYDTEFAFDVLHTAMPLLQRALAADPIDAFHEINELVWHLLRVWDPLGVYKGKLAPDRRQFDVARELCRQIDYKKAAAKISSVTRRDFQQAASFLGFLHRVDPKKAASLCRELDWNRLNATIGSEWGRLEHDSEIFIFQAALDEQARKNVVSIIKGRLSDIKVMPSRIAFLSPELACAVVEQGGVIAIGKDMALSWPVAAIIVQKFGKLCPDLVPVLVAPHESEAASSLQSKQINIFDNADVFLRTLEEISPESLTRILTRVDPIAAETAWVACLKRGGKARQTAAYLVEHCQSSSDELGAVAKRLRRRYPTASIPGKSKSSTDR